MSSVPHPCPVCKGSGQVLVNTTTTTVPQTQPCKPCKGLGIVWGPETEPYVHIEQPKPPPSYPYPPQQYPSQGFPEFFNIIEKHLEDEESKPIEEIIKEEVAIIYKL